MQLEIAFLYMAIWLMMLWLGSAALEATGMERSRAHFQALSALTGTGFTTKDAETVVSHSSRRWIVTWLMFIGNAGFVTVLILIIISVQSNVANISMSHLIWVSVLLVACGLFVWLGMMDRVSDAMVRSMRKRSFLNQDITDWDLLHREGEYGIFRISMQHALHHVDSALKDSPFCKPSIGVLALERDGGVIPFPSPEIKVEPADMLLCYGKIKEIMGITRQD
ncbi:MAG: hypothetical protein ABSG90_02890 [Dehalococcoidia bacterium]|jgi:hypothetical protein